MCVYFLLVLSLEADGYTKKKKNDGNGVEEKQTNKYIIIGTHIHM